MRIPAVIAGALMLLTGLATAADRAPMRESDANLFVFTDFPAAPVPAGTVDLVRMGGGKLALAFADPVRPQTPGEKAGIFHRPAESEEWTHLGSTGGEHAKFASVATADRWILFPFGETSPTRPIEAVVAGSRAELVVGRIPALPGPFQALSATVINNQIHLIGQTRRGSLEGHFLRLNTLAPVWAVIENTPVFSADQVLLASLHQSLYLFAHDSGADRTSAWSYSSLRGWRSLREPPVNVTGALVSRSGDAHLLFFGTPEHPQSIIGYHVTTDGWALMGEVPAARDLIAVGQITELSKELFLPDAVIELEAQMQPTKYGWRDNLVLIAFMVIMVGIGVYLARRERTKADYFRGGRQIPFWASGLSLFATGASGISLMAMPGRAFEDDWAYLTISFFIAATYPLVLLVYVPIARRLNVKTANEYLERRYNLGLRLFGSVVYSLNQIMARLAAIMILPAIAISVIAGIPMETSILIMGLVTTLYATLGGLEGVIWTDVIQAVVMLIAVFLCATWALIALNADPSTAFAAIQSAEKLRSFDLTLSLLGPTSLVLFANVVATTVSMIGDQNFIQRVQCTPTEKDARKAVLTQISVAVPLNVILFSLGTILFLFYRERPEMLNPTIRADGIFPLFAAQNLPAGLAGLVIAALFAATMSTLSSAINSTANLGVEDFYRRLSRQASQRKSLIMSRVLSAFFGILGTFTALWLLHADLRSVWDLAMMLTGMILAPIAGIFFLGIFTNRAHGSGVVIGAAAAIGLTFWVRTYTPIHHFLYLPVGLITCIAVGYLASRVLPNPGKNLKGLTVYTIYGEKTQ